MTMYREHHAMVFRTAYRITGNAADAEDVLQTVFLRMVRRDDSRGRHRASRKLSAAGGGSRGARSGPRQASAADVDLERLPATGGSRPDDGDLRKLSARQYRNSPLVRRKSSHLRFFEGLTNPEIAQRLGNFFDHGGSDTASTRRKILQKKLRAA